MPPIPTIRSDAMEDVTTVTTLDARAPLVFDTRTLRRRAGVMEEFVRTVLLAQDLGTDVIVVPAGESIDLDLRLESVLEGVLASGQVGATARGVCGRCLEPVEYVVDVPFQELYAYPDRVSHFQEVGDDEDDQRVLEGDLLDLEPTVRDAVVLALPFQPLCRPDCPGLCAQCGQPLADDPDHTHDVIDPRWVALSGLASDEASPADDPSNTEEKKR